MMKNKKIVYGVLVVIILTIVGCAPSVLKQPTMPPTTPSESEINLIFKYGVRAKNELNTFKGTYTKDMTVDPPITVNLSLSKEELHKILQKMIEIDFFNYPNKFSVFVPPGEVVGIVTPHSSYYFKVEYDSKIKEMWWEDNITNEDAKAEKLRELINLIINIIESKEEYNKLPEPRGVYL
ncbi:TPA: hypothetical protein DCX16_05980 [bacterium]|nr:hypothetical protein [bacterium]